MAPTKNRKRQRPTSANRNAVPPEDRVEESLRQEILHAFKMAVESYNNSTNDENESDSNRNKSLHISHVKKVLKQLRLVGLKSGDIKTYFDDDTLEMLDSYMFLRLAADKSIQMNKSKTAFDLIDEANKGVVVIEDLQRVCIELGEEMTEDELIEMIEFADTSGEGLLRPKDFLRIAHKVNL